MMRLPQLALAFSVALVLLTSTVVPAQEAAEDPLPPLEEELWLHGGSYLYEPEGDRLNWPSEGSDEHYQVLRLPEGWVAPQPLTAFQEFLGADPIYPWLGLQWFGSEGYQWEPRFVAYGSYELFGIAFEQGHRRQDGIGHNLLVDLDLRVTGTERCHVQFRPLGRKNTGGSFLQLNDPVHYDDNSTPVPDRYWFEGEFYSIFAGLLNDPFAPRDLHFVIGKFPFSLHNGLLMNDDVLGVVINKNTLLIPPFSNINIQAFYACGDVDSDTAPSPELFGLHATADCQHALIEATYAELHDSPGPGHDARYAAASGTQFFGPLTLAGRTLFKWGDQTGRGDGQLFVLESNLTRHFSEGIAGLTGIDHGVFYFNLFKATRGWTSISGGNVDRLRSTFEVDPLLTIALGRDPADAIGGALGVQLFRNDEDESFVPEIAYEAPGGTSVWGAGLRYLRKTGPRTFLEARGVRTWSRDRRFEREGVFVSTFIVF